MTLTTISRASKELPRLKLKRPLTESTMIDLKLPLSQSKKNNSLLQQLPKKVVLSITWSPRIEGKIKVPEEAVKEVAVVEANGEMLLEMLVVEEVVNLTRDLELLSKQTMKVNKFWTIPKRNSEVREETEEVMVKSMKVLTRRMEPVEADAVEVLRMVIDVLDKAKTTMRRLLRRLRKKLLLKKKRRSPNLNTKRSFLVKTSTIILVPSRLLEERNRPELLRRSVPLLSSIRQKKPIKQLSCKTNTRRTPTNSVE
jgi:hypothetical protein